MRFAMGLMMGNYLDEHYRPELPQMVAELRHEDYYINMMRAWYFATLLTKRYEQALPFVEDMRMDAWTHNKAIQKAVESRLIPQERKQHLKSLRVRK